VCVRVTFYRGLGVNRGAKTANRPLRTMLCSN